MKLEMTQARKLAATLLLTSLGACGGGGGGTPGTTDNVPVVTPAEPADGLGKDGHLAGTTAIEGTFLGATATGDSSGRMQVAVGLSDEGRALAVLQLVGGSLKADRVTAWAQSNTAGVWGGGTMLPQAANGDTAVKLTMRMNAAGNAVLGWANGFVAGAIDDPRPKVVRFIQGNGWDPVSYDPMAGLGDVKLPAAGASWDLSMLADNSFTYSGRTTNSVSVVQTNPGGQQRRVLETEQAKSGSMSEISYFAPRANGDGLLYTVENVQIPPFQNNEVRARFAAVNGALLGEISLGVFDHLIAHSNGEYPMVAVTTAANEGVLALTTMESAESYANKLHLIRLYSQSAIRVETARLNTAGTYLPAAPAVVVDKAGNALAVWTESTGRPHYDSTSDTVRMMWSQSLHGAAWTKPQELLGAAAGLNQGYLRRDSIALAMNAEGQAVAAVRLGSLDPTIAVNHFDFKSGWTAWKPVANKQELSLPAVAINASGQAVVAYAGFDVPRVNGKAPGFSNPKQMRMFALRF